MFKIDRTSGFLIRTSEIQNPLVRRTSGFQNFCRTLTGTVSLLGCANELLCQGVESLSGHERLFE